MNIVCSIDTTLRLVLVEYTGNPDFDEWANAMRAVFCDPRFEPGFSFILDRRLATVAPTAEYIKNVAAFVKSHPNELGECHTALVVSGSASYGMGRMSQGLLDDAKRTKIFTDIDEARRWLLNPKDKTGQV